MLDIRQLLYFACCAFYCVLQTQAGVANIEIMEDKFMKRSDEGMHDKLKIKVQHEDGTEFQTEVKSVPTLVARTVSGRVHKDELKDARVYADDINVVMLERKEGNYITKRAILNDVEYERDSDGKMIYSDASHNEIYNVENQIKDRKKRQWSPNPTQLYYDLGLVADESVYLHFLGAGTPTEAMADLRAFFTCITLSVHLRFKRGLNLSVGQINLNVNQFIVIDNPNDTISVVPQSAYLHSQSFNTYIGMNLGSAGQKSDHYLLLEWQEPGSINSHFYSPVVGNACNNSSYAVLVLFHEQFNIGRYIAYDVGLSLGGSATVDIGSDCPGSDVFVMSIFRNTTTFDNPNAWHFSDCSIENLEASINLTSKPCIFTKENDAAIPINIAVKSKDDQCNDFSPTSYFCTAEQDALNFTDLCTGMICSDATTGMCGNVPNMVPAEFTKCTNPANEYYGCIRGTCRFRYKKCFEELDPVNCTMFAEGTNRRRRCIRRECRRKNILRPQSAAASVTRTP